MPGAGPTDRPRRSPSAEAAADFCPSVVKSSVRPALYGSGPACQHADRGAVFSLAAPPLDIVRPVAFLLPSRNCRRGHETSTMRLGIAHHLGWAVVVTAGADHQVVDRRRIELIEPGLPTAPIHHEGGPHALHRSAERLDDRALARLVADVRASAVRATSAALNELAATATEPIASISVRGWPDDFPNDIAVLRRVPYESRADSVMYCQVMAELAHQRGWLVHSYSPKNIENAAACILGDRSDEVLRGPRTALGPPWSKDHRMALAATIVVA